MLKSELLAKQISLNWSKTQIKRYPPKTVYGTVFSTRRYMYLNSFNFQFHEFYCQTYFLKRMLIFLNSVLMFNFFCSDA